MHEADPHAHPTHETQGGPAGSSGGSSDNSTPSEPRSRVRKTAEVLARLYAVLWTLFALIILVNAATSTVSHAVRNAVDPARYIPSIAWLFPLVIGIVAVLGFPILVPWIFGLRPAARFPRTILVAAVGGNVVLAGLVTFLIYSSTTSAFRAAFAPDSAIAGQAAADADEPGPIEKVFLRLPVPTDIEATTLDGEPWSLAAYDDQVVLLDFWASWCAPCITSMDDIVEITESFADEKRFHVVLVNVDADAGRKVIERMDLPGLHVMAGGLEHPLARAFRVGAIPHTELISRAGTSRKVQLQRQSLEQMIRSVVATTKEDYAGQ